MIIDNDVYDFNYKEELSLEEQKQEQAAPNMYHCQTCKVNVEDFFGHVSSPDHKAAYIDNFDEASGTRIID